jgi:methylamine---glutamate N-methyltransferase subunit B
MTETIDMAKTALREANDTLQRQKAGTNKTDWVVMNPKGSHAVAVGLDGPINVTVKGSVGYYCAGMNKEATVTVEGSAGPGVAENMISGIIHIKGDASQYAGATGKGGLLIIDGNASSRCGISMKGIDIVVKGNIGAMSAFMAQAGHLVVLGNAGEALGDSIYEAKLFVRGRVKSLGADCIEKEMRPEHHEALAALLVKAGVTEVKTSEFRRYGSARKLYNFNIDNADAY